MFKKYMILLLLGHIVGDFYVQTSNMAQKKAKQVSWVLIHCLIYFFSVSVVSIPVMSFKILIMDAVVSIFHLMIDISKYYYVKILEKNCNKRKKKERNIFLIDQMFHLICLVGIAYYMTNKNISFDKMDFIANFSDTVGISEMLVATWILALLMIHKPANILIQKLIGTYKPQNKEKESKEDNNAGRFVGTVERVIMLILMSMNQYSAIGLVLTAKSIARYDRIVKSEEFAEYYLLGTLISTAIVIVCTMVLF